MFLTLLRAQTKSFFREKQAMFFAFVFPVFMGVIFGLGVNSSVKPLRLGVVQTARDSTSTQVVSILQHARTPKRQPVFKVKRFLTVAKARSELANGELDGALIMPDLASGGTLKLLVDEKEIERAQRVGNTLDRFVQGMNVTLSGGHEVLQLQTKGIRARGKIGDYNFILPGLIMFGVIFASLTGTTARMADQQQQGVFKRLNLTPLTPLRYILSDVIVRMGVAVVQVTLILALARSVYHANIAGDSLWLYLLAVVGTIIFSMLGIVIAGAARSPEAAGGIASILSLLMFFLGGTLPTDLFPAGLVKAASVLPFTLLVKSMRGVVLDGRSPFVNARVDIGLAVWLLLSIGLASVLFRFRPPKPKKG